ncbi:hypothetical protein DL95DRAFT_36429 [Leptodontidium sp. 2 PMI_412]|nr:hypothetical protein DL95DRAFT_36429 [Leptodontidium sp. 2 PMI_412]
MAVLTCWFCFIALCVVSTNGFYMWIGWYVWKAYLHSTPFALRASCPRLPVSCPHLATALFTIGLLCTRLTSDSQ